MKAVTSINDIYWSKPTLQNSRFSTIPMVVVGVPHRSLIASTIPGSTFAILVESLSLTHGRK